MREALIQLLMLGPEFTYLNACRVVNPYVFSVQSLVDKGFIEPLDGSNRGYWSIPQPFCITEKGKRYINE